MTIFQKLKVAQKKNYWCKKSISDEPGSFLWIRPLLKKIWFLGAHNAPLEAHNSKTWYGVTWFFQHFFNAPSQLVIEYHWSTFLNQISKNLRVSEIKNKKFVSRNKIGFLLHTFQYTKSFVTKKNVPTFRGGGGPCMLLSRTGSVFYTCYILYTYIYIFILYIYIFPSLRKKWQTCATRLSESLGS